jgi:hypothetical protein
MTEAWRAGFADAPPFAHLRPWSRALNGHAWPELAQLNRMAEQASLTNAGGLAVSFQPQRLRCGQRDYEAGILATGQVPTRESNWHDLLNALTWLAFPRTKAALNAIQCRSLAKEGGRRGSLSDAATLFDESGLLLAGPDEMPATLLRERRWREAFAGRREDWGGLRAYVVGHAVLEKLLDPWPGITAKCLFVRLSGLPEEGAPPAELDEAVSACWLGGAIARPADLFPVPVLGIPGWWPDNEQPAFYDNREVFRPARR